MSRGRFFRRQNLLSKRTGVYFHFLLPGCLLLGLGVGCSSAKVEPTLPPVPPSYTAVPHPEGTDLGDLAVVFRSPGAPIYGDFAKNCDSDFKQLRVATVSDQEIADGTRELVKRDPVHYHWCFYSKLMALHDQIKTSDYLEEKQKGVLDTYDFIVPVSRAFAKEFRDSRYLRYSTLQYRKMSEWVFYRKLDLTPAGTEELVEIANPFGLWRDPFAGTPILDKYHIGEARSAAPTLTSASTANSTKVEKPFTSSASASVSGASTALSVSSIVATPPTAPGVDPADVPFEGIGGTPEVAASTAVSAPASVVSSASVGAATSVPAIVPPSVPANATTSPPVSLPAKQAVSAASAPASADDIPFDAPAVTATGTVAASAPATVTANVAPSLANAPTSVPAKPPFNAASAPASADDIPFDTPAPAAPGSVAAVQVSPSLTKPAGISSATGANSGLPPLSVTQRPVADAAIPSAVVPVQKITAPPQLDDNGTGSQTDVISSEPTPKKTPTVASSPLPGAPVVAAASGAVAVPTGLEGIPAEVLAPLVPQSAGPAPASVPTVSSVPKPAPAAAVAKVSPVAASPPAPVAKLATPAKVPLPVTSKPQVAKAVVSKKAAVVPKPAATFNPDTDIPLN